MTGRTADARTFVAVIDQAVLRQPLEMLAHAHGRDAQPFGQGLRGERTLGLEQEEDVFLGIAAVVVHGRDCRLWRPRVQDADRRAEISETKEIAAAPVSR